MKIALLADKYVGLEISKFILENFYQDVAIVFCIKENEIFELAVSKNVNCKIFKDEKNLIKNLYDFEIELGILAWWPNIISKKVYSSIKYGFVNTHNSFLPNNKGMHPYYWAVVENCQYGVTLHWINEGIDTGDIIAQEKIKIGWEDNADSIYRKSLEKMVSLFKQTYPDLRNGKFLSITQANSGSFHYASELDKHSEIKLEKMYVARDILNIIRARTSTSETFKAAYFNDCGKIYRIKIFIEEEG